ncbi:hypothetical protein NTGM5_30095 [Candidatus Nitrotoga sp. M5]|nr:hypothetical protein NTGM5_30095 [Candidatus Nitrotoga sp. M5]
MDVGQASLGGPAYKRYSLGTNTNWLIIWKDENAASWSIENGHLINGYL